MIRHCDRVKNADDAFDQWLKTLTPEDRYDYEHAIGHYDNIVNVYADLIDWLFEPVEGGLYFTGDSPSPSI